MGLNDFINDKNYHSNPKLDKKKLHDSSFCPDCSSSGVHVRGIEYKCPADDCSVIKYFSHSTKINNA